MARNPAYKAVKFIDSTHEVLKSYNKPKTSKRKRTKLTDEQLNILEESYKMNHHPSTEIKETMAIKIGIPVKNVQIWFQNRRAKDKSIKENIISESRKRREEYQFSAYQRHEMSGTAMNDSHMAGYYTDSHLNTQSDYNNMMNNTKNHHPYDYKDSY
ncbi:putative Homeodomain-like, Homeodomain-related, Homeobox protein [Pseudoloma neurophilia]|uniref:Putative Homeodomain-like, Homeodomain-related, Homeobox protein n=1 Tax=Pseudoloma neurophilia TaxID=146866 RepID=A0A0R0M410_9MICR|nr:putative Homeodomain-like, Homeodomain-related, Homeobox protein [Pseudoloma neurophilia]